MTPRKARRGFSLLELLLVVAILTILAGGVVASLGETHDRAAREIALHELAQVKQAVLQFRADMGELPKQGKLDLSAQVPASWTGTAAEYAAWFASPANLSQLVSSTSPLAESDPTNPLNTWNPDRRRGWRGPYLSWSTRGSVVVGEGPGLDGALLAAPVPAIADPFFRDPPGPGAPFQWSDASGRDQGRRGRPIVLLDLNDPASARAVSFGPDGKYDAADPQSDDVVLYLLR